MRILVIAPGAQAPAQLLTTLQMVAGEVASVFSAPDTGAACTELDNALFPFDLCILYNDSATHLLHQFHPLAARGDLPPTIAVCTENTAEAATMLFKAGIEDYVVRDEAQEWLRQLPEAISIVKARHHARSFRSQLDNSVRDSEQRLSQIVEGSSVAMFVIDDEHRVTHWNRACEILTGIATTDVVGTTRQWRAFYPNERPCLADLIVDNAIEKMGGQYYGDKGIRSSAVLAGTYEAEDFFPKIGESGRWLYFTAAPLRDSRGHIVGAIETLQDITDQRRTQESLRAQQTLLRQIIECNSVATFVINEQHQVTHWNKACEVLLGKSAADTIGTRRLANDIYAEDRPVLADLILDNADESEIARYYDGRYRRSPIVDDVIEVDDFFPTLGANGRWIHFAAAPLQDDTGRRIGAIETLIDITERKRAEERLKESERHLAQIIDGSAVATFVIDEQHRVTHWNQACATLTGLPANEMIGTNHQWRAFYPQERPCMADLVLDGAMEDRVAQYYGEKKYHRSQIVSGGYEAQDFFPNFGSSGRWLYFTAAPIRDAEGRIVGAIETLQDITEQKRAEDNLRQSEERYRLLSITDGMTGLYNARFFAQRLREEMDRAQRYQNSLALMVLDVDNFKRFNDTWGHVQGDQVLIRLGECITQSLRRTDQGFRYGGEEFVVLLPETNLSDAEAAAERVRTMFADSEISPAANVFIRCTVSIGVTMFNVGESPKDFVARADSGTYAAKRKGKNSVVVINPLADPQI